MGRQDAIRWLCSGDTGGMNFLWQQPVVLSTKTKNGDEFVYLCETPDASKVYLASRADYDNHIDSQGEPKEK